MFSSDQLIIHDLPSVKASLLTPFLLPLSTLLENSLQVSFISSLLSDAVNCSFIRREVLSGS